jgi:hypothetical protein
LNRHDRHRRTQANIIMIIRRSISHASWADRPPLPGAASRRTGPSNPSTGRAAPGADAAGRRPPRSPRRRGSSPARPGCRRTGRTGRNVSGQGLSLVWLTHLAACPRLSPSFSHVFLCPRSSPVFLLISLTSFDISISSSPAHLRPVAPPEPMAWRLIVSLRVEWLEKCIPARILPDEIGVESGQIATD